MTQARVAHEASLGIGLRDKVGYGLGCFGLDFVWQMAGLYLLYFLTDVAGLSALQAGFVMSSALVWDAVSDPIMGNLAVRWHGKLHGYKIWLLIGLVPMAVSCGLLFALPYFPKESLLGLALLFHVVFRTGHTIINIPYSALNAQMSNDRDVRNSLASYRVVFGLMGGLIIAVMMLPLVSLFGKGNEPFGFLCAALLACCISAVAIISCHALVREHQVGQDMVCRAGWKAFAALALGRRSAQRMSLATVLGGAGLTFFSSILIYFFNLVLGAPDLFSVFIGLVLVIMIVLTPVWAWLAGRSSKWGAWIGGTFLSLLGFALLYAGYGDGRWMTFSALVLIASGVAVFPVMTWSLLADLSDRYSREAGQRVDGHIYSLIVFCQKIGMAIGAGLVALVLALQEYDPSRASSLSDPALFQNTVIFIPCALFILSATLMWRFDP